MIRRILKLSDGPIIRAFEKVASEFEHVKLSFKGQGVIAGEDLELVKKSNGNFLEVVSLACLTWRFTWKRTHTNEADRPPLWDTLERQNEDPQKHRDIGIQIDGRLTAEIERGLAIAPLETDNAVVQRHQETLSKLESVLALHAEESVRARTRHEEDFAARKEALEERIEAVRKADRKGLESAIAAANEDHAERMARITSKEEELAKREQDFKNRDNTHVRREIRDSLKKLAEERLKQFGVSGATRGQYWTIVGISIVAIALTVSGVVFFGAQSIANPDPTLRIASIVKTGVLLATAIGLGSWFMRWLNRWFQRIADSEFKLQQFRLDIERASWLAETVLEWRSNAKDKEPFPEVLATRLSAGLFHSARDEVDDPKTPVGQLAEALLGAASSVRLKMGENEVNMDRKGMQQLKE